MKHKHAIVFCLSLLICANLAMAQDPKKFELGVFGGRTGSEGIEVEATAIGGGQVVTQLGGVPRTLTVRAAGAVAMNRAEARP
jgi:hypothetical protein